MTGSGGGGFTVDGSSTVPSDCTGLQCQIQPCDGQPKTTISGVVYDPAGSIPLYNVVVYVPNEQLAPIPSGAACETCDGPFSGKPIAVGLSGPDGRFVVENAPVGTDIPLVIQVGKWRRQITVPNVPACSDTALTDANLTRLPRNQAEGNIPKIAIATGGSDALECLLRKIGVEDSEFTTETGTGRVNLFAGDVPTEARTMANGTALTSADVLWDSRDLLFGYDMMLMSCEGTDNNSRSATQYANVHAYADAGGRIFGSHWHNGWINPENTTFPNVVTFSSGAHGFDAPITASIDMTFPKGQAFGAWLLNVGGSTTLGSITITGAEHSVDSAVANVSQQWIYGTDPDRGTPMLQYFSFNTPVGGAQCGRMVFSDVHVSAGAGSDSGKLPFPSGCTSTTLSPQEKALEFMIFDLSSCVQPDGAEVRPPSVIE